MFQMNYDIKFNNGGKKFQLLMLSSVEIEKSCENLVDIATILLPESVLNNPLNIESKIKRGTEVSIKLGYDGKLIPEFVGYVTEIVNSGGSLNIKCEDALFLFRKKVENKIFKPASISSIANYLISQIDSSFTLVCDFNFTYEKYTIYQADGYDVLKKLQEETKANIYFNTEKKELHIHAPYLQKSGNVKYRMNRNVESSSLEFKRATDRKLQVTIECTGLDGKLQSYTSGTPGGETFTKKVGSTADLKILADTELMLRMADKYEGTIDTWLIPYCEPTFTADFKDDDYPDKAGLYYVTSTKVSFSESGGVRTIGFGIKLSENGL
jgi:hypothetical protein